PARPAQPELRFQYRAQRSRRRQLQQLAWLAVQRGLVRKQLRRAAAPELRQRAELPVRRGLFPAVVLSICQTDGDVSPRSRSPAPSRAPAPPQVPEPSSLPGSLLAPG